MEDSPIRLDTGIISHDSDELDKQSIKSGQDEDDDVTCTTTESLPEQFDTSEEASTHRNPFSLPDDSKLFSLRNKEKQLKRLEMERQRGLKIHEKVSSKPKFNIRAVTMAKSEENEMNIKQSSVKDDPDHSLAVTRDRYVERESLTDYIAKKREIFLVEYSLSVKRNEILKLQKMVEKERESLEKGEQRLYKEASTFDSFLKENNHKSNKAMREAEREAREKAEKLIEIKHLTAMMVAIKSEIAKYDDLLQEYSMFRKFLDELSPQEWKDEKKRARYPHVEGDPSQTELTSPEKFEGHQSKVVKRPKTKKAAKKPPTKKSAKGDNKRRPEETATKDTVTDDANDSSEEEVDLYFSRPEELLAIFTELEEQNLSLIQNSQVTEEAVESMKHKIRDTENKMERETTKLKEHIAELKVQIEKQETKMDLFRKKAQFCNFGEFDDKGLQSVLDVLNQKVEGVYEACIGSNYANLNTLQMLTNIENRIEVQFALIEKIPFEKLEQAQKAKDKERRRQQRKDKALLQKSRQEERLKKALARSNAETKIQVGRKLIFQSEPPRRGKLEKGNSSQYKRDEEEYSFFFKD